MATQIVGSLLALEALDDEEDIRIYINSPGEPTADMHDQLLRLFNVLLSTSVTPVPPLTCTFI
jgi:ATP-dependent protease ClpP protease subunit